MPHDLFISYAHQGDNTSREAVAALAARLHAELEADFRRRFNRDLAIFFDKEDIQKRGQSYIVSQPTHRPIIGYMPRKLRIQYPRALYHVMNRGDRREEIYADGEDRRRFLATLGQACEKTGWQVHGCRLIERVQDI